MRQGHVAEDRLLQVLPKIKLQVQLMLGLNLLKAYLIKKLLVKLVTYGKGCNFSNSLIQTIVMQVRPAINYISKNITFRGPQFPFV